MSQNKSESHTAWSLKNEKIIAALIAGIVSIIVAIVTTIVSINLSEREERINFYTSVQVKILDHRAKNYAELFHDFVLLSSFHEPRMSDEDAKKLGRKVNFWLYGEGGMFASTHTRGHAASLRTALLTWQSFDDSYPSARQAWSNLIKSMRADLNLCGDLPSNREAIPSLDIHTFDNCISPSEETLN